MLEKLCSIAGKYIKHPLICQPENETPENETVSAKLKCPPEKVTDKNMLRRVILAGEYERFIEKKMNIKFVVSDLDGTLLNPQSELSLNAIKSVALLLEKDFRFTLCSGRNLGRVLPFANTLGVKEPLITTGGALVVDAHANTIINRQGLAENELAWMVDYARQADLGILFMFTDEAVYELRSNNGKGVYPARFLDLIQGVPDLLFLDTSDVLKINLFGSPEKLQAAKEFIEKNSSSFELCFVEGHLEILRRNVNKGNALVHLAQYLDIPLESVLVIGDDANDISMFKVAGYSVAMGNALEELKEIADEICLSNAEDGAALFFKELAMGRFVPHVKSLS